MKWIAHRDNMANSSEFRGYQESKEFDFVAVESYSLSDIWKVKVKLGYA